MVDKKDYALEQVIKIAEEYKKSDLLVEKLQASDKFYTFIRKNVPKELHDYYSTRYYEYRR